MPPKAVREVRKPSPASARSLHLWTVWPMSGQTAPFRPFMSKKQGAIGLAQAPLGCSLRSGPSGGALQGREASILWMMRVACQGPRTPPAGSDVGRGRATTLSTSVEGVVGSPQHDLTWFSHAERSPSVGRD